MDESLSFTENFESFMSQNTKGVQVGVYSVAFVGLAVALRKIRPFSRFSRPNDVPNRFLTLRTRLYGTVERIEPTGALLMITHKPLIPILPLSGKTLPVKVSGITVNGNGISWLQSIVAGNEVTFIPVLKEEHCVHCEVMLQQVHEFRWCRYHRVRMFKQPVIEIMRTVLEISDFYATIKDIPSDNDCLLYMKKKMNILNVGPALVQIGFGTVCPVEKALADNPLYAYYYSQLRLAENRAAKSRLGYWYYIQITREFTQKLLIFFANLMKQNQKKASQLVSA